MHTCYATAFVPQNLPIIPLVTHIPTSLLVMSSTSVDFGSTGPRRSSVLSSYSTSSVTTIENERTPLVPKVNHSLTSPTTYRKEVRWLFTNSLPIVVTYLLQTSLQMASVFSLGHIVSSNKKIHGLSLRKLADHHWFLFLIGPH